MITVVVVVAWALTSVVVAAAGPFGTFGTRPFVWELLYWGGLIAAAIVLAVALRVVVRQCFQGLKTWVEDIVVAVLLSLVFGPMVLWVNRALTQEQSPGGLGLAACIAIVFVVAIAIIALRHALLHTARIDVEPEQDRLLQRLEVPNGVRISAVSSDNHHVNILTDDGQSHRILMRLRDAVNEIDREAGVCIHRSHWVATRAIAKLVNCDGREAVELPCGAHLPIGPKYRENLVQTGFITDEDTPQAGSGLRVFR